jgi:hypothetical protein
MMPFGHKTTETASLKLHNMATVPQYTVIFMLLHNMFIHFPVNGIDMRKRKEGSIFT